MHLPVRRLAVFSVLVTMASLPAIRACAAEPALPLTLRPGVHLLIDDHYVAKSDRVQRRVQQPRRTLNEPIVGGSVEQQNWQPFLTVVHDRARPARPFRMWYNVDVIDNTTDGEYFGATGLLESADGIHWPGPYNRLTTLAIDGRVRFGASVLDDGPDHSVPAERYKMLYFDAGKDAGPRVAFSADGITWAMHDGGKPVIGTNNGDDIWTSGYDPIRKRYFLIGKTFVPCTWTNAEGQTVTATIRRYFTRFSSDFKTWSEPKMVYSPDERDEGITQWYGSAGYLVRGDLMVGFLRVLRDDLTTEGAPPEAIAANTKGSAGLGSSGLGTSGGAGMGYTVLTWTRDGQTWHRDRHTDKFFEPDPRVGSWDHAMAWVGSAVPVDNEVLLYYAGYRWGHKYHHSIDRQIGLVKMKRDRYVARSADADGGTLTTRVMTMNAETLLLNVDSSAGDVRVQVCDATGQPIPGYRFEDCRAVKLDALEAPVQWARPLSILRDRPVVLQFSLRQASLFAFETR